MLMAERRRLILEHVRRRGVVSLRDMASVLGTSEITVRRDLAALADEGLVNRTVEPTGTIVRTVYDNLGRQVSRVDEPNTSDLPEGDAHVGAKGPTPEAGP